MTINKLPVTWANILNYRHIPPASHSLSTFADEARKLGYPYINWNDWIYDLETEKQVISADDVDKIIVTPFVDFEFRVAKNSTTEDNIRDWADEQDVLTIHYTNIEVTPDEYIVTIYPLNELQITLEYKAKLWLSFYSKFD